MVKIDVRGNNAAIKMMRVLVTYDNIKRGEEICKLFRILFNWFDQIFLNTNKRET